MKHKYLITAIVSILYVFNYGITNAQEDTLNVIAYNVLHFGDGCQGTNAFLFTQLKTIVKYESPDILGFVKAGSIQVTPTDNNGISAYGFADSIIKNALDVPFPSRYNYCALTNISGSNDMDVLFYNQNKLGFVSVKNLLSLQEDFDLYKLYYKDPNLSTTHDSTFLYIILNHTVSGTAAAGRDQQDTLIIDQLKKIFYHLPNLISMGDFNAHSSGEVGYERYTQWTDTSFAFYDPPFNPDHKLSYPLAWETSLSTSAAYLNTTTRESSTYPNNCGTSGGAKSWYIHQFISGWITNNKDFVKYIPDSYTTLGNDGNRVGISENDSSSVKNSSAPSNVVNAIFQLSDKYPIMLKLAVTYNTTGSGPSNPVNAVNNVMAERGEIVVNNPVKNEMIMHFPSASVGQKCVVECYDICGRIVFSEEMQISSTTVAKAINFNSGTYILRVQTANTINVFRIVKM